MKEKGGYPSILSPTPQLTKSKINIVPWQVINRTILYLTRIAYHSDDQQHVYAYALLT